MGSPFHLLCPRYSGPLSFTVPTANRLWETFLIRKDKINMISLRDPDRRAFEDNAKIIFLISQ